MPTEIEAAIGRAHHFQSRAWLQHLEGMNYSAETIRCYVSDLNIWTEHLEACGKGLEEVDFRFIHDWIRKFRQGGRSVKTTLRKISCFREFYRWLHRSGFVKSNPFLEIDRLKAPRRIPEFLTEGEVDRLLKSAKTGGRKNTRGEYMGTLLLIVLIVLLIENSRLYAQIQRLYREREAQNRALEATVRERTRLSYTSDAPDDQRSFDFRRGPFTTE